MKPIFVTEDVLNNGTLCNAEQPPNIEVIFVTEDVLNNGTLCNE